MNAMVVALLIRVAPCASDVPPALAELFKSADQHNLDYKISKAQHEKANAEFDVAWSSLLPGLTAQGSWTRNQYPLDLQIGGRGVTIVPENQFDGVLRAEMPLIDLTRWARIAATSTAEDAAQFRQQATADVVHTQVATTYFGYAAALAVKQAAARALELSELQLRDQEVRNQVRAATELDLLRSRAEVQRNRQICADADVLVTTQQRLLFSLTGVAVEHADLPADDLEPLASLETFESRVDTVPRVAAAEKDAHAARNLARTAKLAFIPALNANFTERYTNATGFLGKEKLWSAGIGLVWPLNVPMVFGVAAQQTVSDVATLIAERQRQETRDLIHNNWQRVRAAREKILAATAQVEAAQRAAQVARDRYAVGAATQVETITAERDLFLAQVGQLQARSELASSRIALQISAAMDLVSRE